MIDLAMLSCLAHIMEKLSAIEGIEKVFLLAEQKNFKTCYSIFTNIAPGIECASRYLFLILVSDSIANRSVENSIEVGQDCSPVTTWLMKRTAFEKALNDKDFFAVKINASACLLFDSSNPSWCHTSSWSSLPMPHTSADLQVHAISIDSWLNRSHEFFAGAQLYLLRKQPKMAAFCLHQSAEQAYTAIVFRFMGIRPETHNLLRLHGYASFFLPGLVNLFPDHDSAENCLLRRLQKAYIDVRYSDQFYLSSDKINILCEKIHSLYQFALETSRPH